MHNINVMPYGHFVTNIGKDRTRTFSIGDICKINVPEEKMQGYKFFIDAIVEVSSKKEFLKMHPAHNNSTVGNEKVVVKLISGNSLPDRMIGKIYPIRRLWLEKIDRHYCSCDLKSVLMITGCVCGGD